MDGRPHAPESAGCSYAGAAVEVVPHGAASRRLKKLACWRRQRREEGVDGGGVDGFGQVQVEAGFLRSQAILVLAPAGDRNHHRISESCDFADATAGFVSVHSWHAYVQHHYVGSELRG